VDKGLSPLQGQTAELDPQLDELLKIVSADMEHTKVRQTDARATGGLKGADFELRHRLRRHAWENYDAMPVDDPA
jgi:hypothetical protein